MGKVNSKPVIVHLSDILKTICEKIPIRLRRKRTFFEKKNMNLRSVTAVTLLRFIYTTNYDTQSRIGIKMVPHISAMMLQDDLDCHSLNIQRDNMQVFRSEVL